MPNSEEPKPAPKPSPFDDPENSQVLISKDILRGAAVVHISHDDDDSWSFLSDTPQAGQFTFAPLQRVIDREPEILYRQHMPPGQSASYVAGRWFFRESEKLKKARADEAAAAATCFIATAVYGSSDTLSVTTLRVFRDECLMHYAIGRLIVKSYNALSPPIAVRIARSNALKAVARFAVVLPTLGLARVWLSLRNPREGENIKQFDADRFRK